MQLVNKHLVKRHSVNFLPFVFFHKIILKMIKELIGVASFALKWQMPTRYGNIETSFGINTHQDAFAFEKFFEKSFAILPHESARPTCLGHLGRHNTVYRIGPRTRNRVKMRPKT
jgi:hypothetical protein